MLFCLHFVFNLTFRSPLNEVFKNVYLWANKIIYLQLIYYERPDIEGKSRIN